MLKLILRIQLYNVVGLKIAAGILAAKILERIFLAIVRTWFTKR